MAKHTVAHSRALELFDYDAETGNLIWRISTSNRVKIGEVAGAVGVNGRRYISVDGISHMAHRLVWLRQTGEWPSENIAPKNGDYLDTRIENLVAETAAETVHKSKARSTNKSGVKGISWDGAKQSWAVHVYREYKSIYVGRYKELDDAIAAKENADHGVMPSAEDKELRKTEKMSKIRESRLWHRMLKDNNGIHGWGSVDDFMSDARLQTKDKRRLVKVDESRPIGPSNFEWVIPEFDYQTKDGRASYRRNHRAKNPEMYKDKDLRKKFGISIAEYHTKLEAQNGVCAICFKPEFGTRNGIVRWMNVDHNHKTGEVRGLLCTNCNVAIGMLQDSTELLRSAISYLDKWNGVESKESVPPGT